MDFKFDTLFKVEFRHQYFDDALYNGFTITPSGNTQELMQRHGLVFKAKDGGFFIGYDAIAGAGSREEVLKMNAVLTFRLNLTDLNLYNYTDNLPENINGAIFHFKNFTIPEGRSVTNTKFNEQDEENKPGEIDDPSILTPWEFLLQLKFVSEFDLDERPAFKNQYFSKPFGQVSVLVHGGLQKEFTIKLASRATKWQYILVSEHLYGLKKPAIINRATQRPLPGPVPIPLPDNRPGLAFISEEPIILTSTPNRNFFLVENYEPNNQQHNIVINYLPGPDISMISDIETKTFSDSETEEFTAVVIEAFKISKKKYVNIIL